MDISKQNAAFCCFVVVISGFTLGLCSSQDISLYDLLSDSDLEPRARRTPYSTFDPEMDWSRQETDPDWDNTLVNLLKRNIYSLEGGSGRYPRINRRKMIPFYQYGNEFRSYRPRQRFNGPRRYSYFVSPWKSGSYNAGTRNQRLPFFGGY